MKKPQYFFETGEAVPFDETNGKVGIHVKKQLYTGSSLYQKIQFFDTTFFKRILVLDGIVQVSEKDEFIYHELLCHPALFAHKNPKRVLVIGGGDGGCLREIVKHKSVQEAWMVEIDKKVVDLCQQYLPSLSQGAFTNKKTHLHIGDAGAFIQQYKDFFDVIILDLSDPGGPAQKLISLSFYKSVQRALAKGGVIGVQSGSVTVQPKLVEIIAKRLHTVFRFVEIRTTSIPVFHAGMYSFITASNENIEKISIQTLAARYKKAGIALRFWSPEVHKATAVLPIYMQQLLHI
jgi:spermidine synthase